MLIREMTERIEEQTLSPYAVLAKNAEPRLKPQPRCDIRTEFQRDRDRIIHSKPFRRLKHKTQVFIAPEGDHYRTRLTHTLEVSQIGRTIARSLRLNEDLVEAMALAHDLGHTPFGHAGERVLDELSACGFDHSEQSLRVVDVLENLNLTGEVRDGILMHNGEKKARTLEGVVLKFADRIAYINHDIDDALRGGVLQKSDIPKELTDVLGDTHSKRINTMICDIVSNSAGKGEILMSEAIGGATDRLRAFMFDRVYTRPSKLTREEKVRHILAALYGYYHQNPEEMPPHMVEISGAWGVERAVCDFIAGMTDRFAICRFEALFVPGSWVNL